MVAERIVYLHIYETSLERSGAALAVGGAIVGVLALLLVAAGGHASRATTMLALPVGMLIGALGITALAGPIWIVLHAMGRRRARHAILMGAAIGFALFLCGQTYGFGLEPHPPSDGQTMLYRWISAIATSVLPALAGAGIGWAMWRTAYRRVR